MLCASVIGLAALSLASLGFFVWCWLHFRDDTRSHPIYRATQVSESTAREGREIDAKNVVHSLSRMKSLSPEEIASCDLNNRHRQNKTKRGLLQWQIKE